MKRFVRISLSFIVGIIVVASIVGRMCRTGVKKDTEN